MKPFLLLQIRPVDAASDNEFEAFLKYGGLSEAQVHRFRMEKEELIPLYDEIFEKDFPFFGACYGIGSLAKYTGAKVSREKYSEPPGAVVIRLKEEAKEDPILKNVVSKFDAFVGHKEACQELPPGATLLASSERCPFQMIRFKKNIYATQFHPELDFDGLKLRVGIYMYEGYFKPDEAKALLERNQDVKVFAPEQILKNFVEIYKKK